MAKADEWEEQIAQQLYDVFRTQAGSRGYPTDVFDDADYRASVTNTIAGVLRTKGRHDRSCGAMDTLQRMMEGAAGKYRV